MVDIFLERYPKIDLHGYDRDSARLMVNDFISDNIILGNEIIVIIQICNTSTKKKNNYWYIEYNKFNKNIQELYILK